jgi:release factor glutamine methyltransferase
VSERWTTLRVLDWTTGRFERAGIESARLDAQVLLAHVLECQRVALYTSFDRPLEDAELLAYRQLIQRRLEGEPVAYLTGQKEFWSLRLRRRSARIDSAPRHRDAGAARSRARRFAGW